MKRVFILLMAMVLIPIAGLMSQVTLEGTVRDDATGEGVAGAHVFLDDSYRGTFTDSRGQFVFSRVEAGEYTLRVSHVSFTPYEEMVTLLGDKVVIEVSLEARVHMSEEFIVTAVRGSEQVPGASTTVQREELRSINLGQDLPFLLSVQPSVVHTSDAGTGVGYTGMRIRGVDQNRINVTINGIPLNDPESHAVYWVNMPDFAASIEEVQIQRGVGTSTNGAGAFGASVNIRTEQLNPKPYAHASMMGGSFNTMRTSVGFGSGLMENRFAFDGRFSRITSDGFIDRAFANLNSLYLSGGYYGKRTILKGVVMLGHERTYLAWSGIPSEVLDTNRTFNPLGIYYGPDGEVRYYDNEVDDYRQNHYQLHLIHRLSSQWNLNMALHATTGLGFYEGYKTNRRLSNYGLPNVVYGNDTIRRSDLIQRKWLDNTFYGATWSLIRSAAQSELTIGGAANIYDGDHFGTLPWIQHPGEVDKDHEWYFNNGLKRDANTFVKYLYRLTPKLVLFGDAQVRYIDYVIDGFDDDLRDVSQQHDYLFFNPKAGMSYRFNDRHESWFFSGIAHREPNRKNFTDAPEGELPRAERLYNAEAGHRYGSQNIAVSANVYLMYYTDQLVLTGEINQVGAPIMTNVERSYRTGIELAAAWRPTSMITWEANATFSRNTILDFTAYVDNWDTWSQEVEPLGNTTIAFSPSVIANNIFRVTPVQNLQISLVNQYVGNQYLDNTGSSERMLDPWLVHNIHFRYVLNTQHVSNVEFHLLLNNILGEEYVSNGWIYRYYEGGEHRTMDGLFPQAGFHLMGGLSVRF